MINDKTFTEWFDEQPDYGICSPPMNAQMAMDYLFDYLDIPPIVISQNNEQCNTEVVFEILMRYSKKFRKEYRQYRKKKRRTEMKIPKFNWIPFDKDNPPTDLLEEKEYLILLREDHYDNGATWTYHVDIATAYGSYLDGFWNTTNDWDEGQRIEVLAYCKTPYGMKEEDLVESEN